MYQYTVVSLSFGVLRHQVLNLRGAVVGTYNDINRAQRAALTMTKMELFLDNK